MLAQENKEVDLPLDLTLALYLLNFEKELPFDRLDQVMGTIAPARHLTAVGEPDEAAVLDDLRQLIRS